MAMRRIVQALLAAGLLQLATAPAAGASPTALQLLRITETCDPLPGVGRFKTDASRAISDIRLCRYKNAIWFKADLDIDCDGGSTAACKADASYQPETSCVASTGRYLDASTLPFYVLPLNSNGFTISDYGIKCGSVGAVIYNGKLEYAIMGDRGPAGVIGEASYALAERLGINPDPNAGGVSSGVTYILFTGRQAVLSSPIESHPRAIALGEQLASNLIADQSSNLQIQRPTSGQVFSVRERVSFEGTAADDIAVVKLIADDRWQLAQGSPDQGRWSLTYSFLAGGDRSIRAVGLNVNGREIASASVDLKIKDAQASDVTSRIVTLANQEWQFFGRQTMRNDSLVNRGRTEGEDGYWQRVVRYWREGVRREDVNTREKVMSDGNPWSAAFVSYVMRTSGAGSDFKYSSSHATYIIDAIRNRQRGETGAAFIGHRITEYAPKRGDLVCAPRGWAVGQVTFDNATNRDFFPSHCDIVVDVRGTEIDIIGGNVSQSVTRNTVRTVAGMVVPGPNRKWFVVIENRLDSMGG